MVLGSYAVIEFQFLSGSISSATTFGSYEPDCARNVSVPIRFDQLSNQSGDYLGEYLTPVSVPIRFDQLSNLTVGFRRTNLIFGLSFSSYQVRSAQQLVGIDNRGVVYRCFSSYQVRSAQQRTAMIIVGPNAMGFQFLSGSISSAT